MTAEALLIGGRSGVGKSTAALALHRLLIRRGVQHAVIEGDNLDLAHPEPWTTFPDAHLAERNLAAMWRNYRELGFRRLIYTNTAAVVTVPTLVAALDEPDLILTAVLLRGNDETVERRLTSRQQPSELVASLESSARSSAWLDRDASEDVHRLDTDGMTLEQVALRLASLTGWIGDD